MRITPSTLVARLPLDETVTGLWSFANALGLLTDDIGERTGGAGVTVDGLFIRDAGVPEAVVTAHEAALSILGAQIVSLVEGQVTAHEAALSILESQIVDGALLARLAAAETVAGAWTLDALLTLHDQVFWEDFAAAGDTILKTTVLGDSDRRFGVLADGALAWGPGDAAVDTNLFRNAADELKTDDALTVAGALTAEHDFIVDEVRLLLAASGDNIDMEGKTILYVDATGAQDITGFAGGLEGKIIAVVNRDAVDTITLKHADGGSSAGNRMALPGDADHALTTREGAVLYYSSDDSWKIIAAL